MRRASMADMIAPFEVLPAQELSEGRPHLQKATDAERRFQSEEARSNGLEKERDSLQANLKARVTEKEQLQTQFDGFRKNLKELVVQMDSASALPLNSPTVQLTLPIRGQ